MSGKGVSSLQPFPPVAPLLTFQFFQSTGLSTESSLDGTGCQTEAWGPEGGVVEDLSWNCSDYFVAAR